MRYNRICVTSNYVPEEIIKSLNLSFAFNAASHIEQVLEANNLQNSSYTATYYPSRKISKLDEPDMRDIIGEARTIS